MDLEASEDYSLEEDLVKHGFKWSPVKKYFGRLGGIRSNPWGLTVSLLDRDRHTTKDPLSFVLLVTITDPKGTDVYTDIVQQLRDRFAFRNLPLRDSVRVQLGLDT